MNMAVEKAIYEMQQLVSKLPSMSEERNKLYKLSCKAKEAYDICQGRFMAMEAEIDRAHREVKRVMHQVALEGGE